MSFRIPEEIEYVINKIMDTGYEAYLVGGCVRDFLMGEEPKDYDVNTSATPEEIHAILGSDAHIIDTGIKHGTVTVIRNHVPMEVTTYRKESVYSDGRHPDKVNFSSDLTEDLARRDFTMNAVAYNMSGGFVDPFNGMVDIENSTIRCVGEPKERLREDGLRIMRALRFSSSLGFEIEERTKAALFDEKDRLSLISSERIQKELEGILLGCDVERVLRDYADVISAVIPEIVPMIGFDQHNPYHIYDVWEHTIRVVSGVPENPALRLAALFHDIGKPSCFTQGDNGVGHFYGHPEVSVEIAGRIMRRLKFDNVTRDAVLTLVRWHDLVPSPTDKSVRKSIMRLGEDLFDSWISLKRGDNRAQAMHISGRQEEISEIERIGHRLIEKEGEFSLRTLRINGRDLASLGIKQGAEMGIILNHILDEVVEERLANESGVLLEYAKSYIAKNKLA